MNLKQILLDIFQGHQEGEQRGDKRENTNHPLSLRSPSTFYSNPKEDYYLGVGAMTEYDLWRLSINGTTKEEVA